MRKSLVRRPLHPNRAGDEQLAPFVAAVLCQPLSRGANTGGAGGAPAVGSGPQLSADRRIFTAIYLNPRKKKEMSQDGFVVATVGARLALHDERGKQLAARPWRNEDGALASGSETALGGLSCELLETVTPDAFDSIASSSARPASIPSSNGQQEIDTGAQQHVASTVPPPVAFQAQRASGAARRVDSAVKEEPAAVARAAPGPSREEAAPSGSASLPAPARSFPFPRRDASRGAIAIVNQSCEPPGALLLNAGDCDATPVCVDAHLARQMRPHQKEGVQFMYDCFTGRRLAAEGQPVNGCILAHCMGLGKSLQALALIHTLLKQGPRGVPLIRKAVIVCPASLVDNWAAECHRWLGPARLKPTLLPQGKAAAATAAREFSACRPQVLLIIGYETLRSHAEAISNADVGLLICDEGHRLKNAAGSQTMDALRAVGRGAVAGDGGCKRVVLTGTPMQNDLEELWAMCDFASPAALPPLAHFRTFYAGPIDAAQKPDASQSQKELAEERRHQLREATEAFMQRRDRSVLDKLLPTRRELVLCCALTPFQQTRYAEALSNLDSGGRAGPEHLAAIMQLRAICSNGGASRENAQDEEVALVSDVVRPRGGPHDLSKISVLLQLVPTVVAAGDRVVIVCQFQSTLNLLERGLRTAGLGCMRVDGKVSAEKRQELINRFNAPRASESVFLLSTRAGGTGFNLTSANRLILFDPDWNPAADEQAMARVFRDGQHRDVTIWRLLSAGTVEEKMLQRQLFKSDLASAVSGGNTDVWSGGASENKFSSDELKALFRYDAHARCDTLTLLLAAAGRSAELMAMTAREQWLPLLPDPMLRDAVASLPAARTLITYACEDTVLRALRGKDAQSRANSTSNDALTASDPPSPDASDSASPTVAMPLRRSEAGTHCAASRGNVFSLDIDNSDVDEACDVELARPRQQQEAASAVDSAPLPKRRRSIIIASDDEHG